MSATDTLRAEVQQYIQTADAGFLQNVKEMYETRQTVAKDWWDETPEHIKASLREALESPYEGKYYTWEEVKAAGRKWLSK